MLAQFKNNPLGLLSFVRGQMSLVKNPDGLYSPSETLYTTKGTGLSDLIKESVNNSRSTYFPKNIRFSSLTPLWLYLIKEAHGISYNSWDWSDPEIRYLVAADMLYKSVIAAKDGTINFPLLVSTYKESPELRDVLCVSPTKGLMAKTANTAFGIPFQHKPAYFMAAQLWNAHSSVRVPDAMILDLTDNLEYVPDPLDVVTTSYLVPGIDKKARKDSSLKDISEVRW